MSNVHYEIVEIQGRPKVRHKRSGEVMHAGGSSELEVETIYIEQSRMRERLKGLKSNEILTIWDVGLGGGINATAVVNIAESIKHSGLIRLVSFENDLESANLVCEHAKVFSNVRTELLTILLRDRVYKSEQFEWTLIQGDFIQTFQSALSNGTPDICFFDPFSPKTDSDMWSYSLFCSLFENMHDRPFELFTYSQSTAVRAGLAAAGFNVAQGVACPPKESSTIACTNSSFRNLRTRFEFLGERWLKRWENSSSKFPIGVEDEELFEQNLRRLIHSQI